MLSTRGGARVVVKVDIRSRAQCDIRKGELLLCTGTESKSHMEGAVLVLAAAT